MDGCELYPKKIPEFIYLCKAPNTAENVERIEEGIELKVDEILRREDRCTRSQLYGMIKLRFKNNVSIRHYEWNEEESIISCYAYPYATCVFCIILYIKVRYMAI